MDYLGYIVITLALGMLLLQFLAWRSARKMIGRKAPSYDRAPDSDTPDSDTTELFYFYSPSCAACRPMTPVMEELASQQAKVHIVDITQQGRLATEFNVRATPSLVKVRSGVIKDVQLGAKTEKQILALLEPPASP